jgi:uncharacterized protein YpuA (DUF1002 family)
VIESYLTNRIQAKTLASYDRITKTVRNIQSSYEINIQGVPQGSVLGPLLFLVYVKEFPLVINHPCVMFADDATIFLSEDYDTNITNVLYTTIKTVTYWSLNLCVNLDKTKIEQFTHYKQIPQSLSIKIEEKQIEQVTNTNFVTIDSNLNWKSHTNKINNRLAKCCYALSIAAPK